MTPRELDALVAEKVMDWRTSECQSDVGEYPGLWICPSCGEEGTYEKGFIHNTRMPNYSTDISAAWQVVEKMKMSILSPGAPFAWDEYRNGEEWTAEALCRQTGDKFITSEIVSADTAPRAICLAALKAVGIDINKFDH